MFRENKGGVPVPSYVFSSSFHLPACLPARLPRTSVSTSSIHPFTHQHRVSRTPLFIVTYVPSHDCFGPHISPNNYVLSCTTLFTTHTYRTLYNVIIPLSVFSLPDLSFLYQAFNTFFILSDTFSGIFTWDYYNTNFLFLSFLCLFLSENCTHYVWMYQHNVYLPPFWKVVGQL